MYISIMKESLLHSSAHFIIYSNAENFFYYTNFFSLSVKFNLKSARLFRGKNPWIDFDRKIVNEKFFYGEISWKLYQHLVKKIYWLFLSTTKSHFLKAYRKEYSICVLSSNSSGKKIHTVTLFVSISLYIMTHWSSSEERFLHEII